MPIELWIGRIYGPSFECIVPMLGDDTVPTQYKDSPYRNKWVSASEPVADPLDFVARPTFSNRWELSVEEYQQLIESAPSLKLEELVNGERSYPITKATLEAVDNIPDHSTILPLKEWLKYWMEFSVVNFDNPTLKVESYHL